MTSKLGFSVVAPIKVISPDSTCGKNASCCALLKRWISSTNKIVRKPKFQFCRACSITFSTSFLPLVTALSSINSAFTSCAIIRASVVFPVPGGPQKIKLTGSPCTTIWRNSSPLPSNCPCPITSSKLFGRIRSASGTLSILVLYRDTWCKKIERYSPVFVLLVEPCDNYKQ